jgi:lipoate-protein ligase A
MTDGDVERELETDTALLDAAEKGAAACFRLWTTSRTTVVVGRGVTIAEEVDESACDLHSVAVIRRESGGRSVVVGPGTLQYAFVLPYSLSEELLEITSSKRFCNAMLAPALEGGTRRARGTLRFDVSGDLVCDGRKVAGLALRRRRLAMLLHGTILVNADLDLIAALLRHPQQEPAYRCGRSHTDFLANVGPVDEGLLDERVRERLAAAVASVTVRRDHS